MRSETVAPLLRGGIYINFNPLAPCGARPAYLPNQTLEVVFQSTRSVRSETPGDAFGAPACSYFNPLAPCGARHFYYLYPNVVYTFQSTRSVRSETNGQPLSPPHIENFNPLAPCGARHAELIASLNIPLFQSTRSVRSETRPDERALVFTKFQSTRSVRSETATNKLVAPFAFISIHSLRAERDFLRNKKPARSYHFNPLAPCGARPVFLGYRQRIIVFQSTRSVRSETAKPNHCPV